MVEQMKKTNAVALEKEMEGARRATGISFSSADAAASEPDDPEVLEKASRRRFTAKYKLGILEEAEHCGPGQIGALLRREGLFSSHLTSWRRLRDQGALAGLSPQKRGRKPDPAAAQRRENAKLQKENERLQLKLKKAHTIIEFQKKLSEILDIPMDSSHLEKKL